MIIIRFNKKITSNKAKNKKLENDLDELEKEVRTISAKGLTADLINKCSILNGEKPFSSNELQDHLVFISNNSSAKCTKNANNMNLWETKGMSRESIINSYTSASNFSPESTDNKKFYLI